MPATGDDLNRPDKLGQRLRRRRLELRMSQTDVAGEVLSPSYVSLLESGKRTPTADVLEVLAQRLDCTTCFLLRGEEAERYEVARLTVTYAELATRNGEAADALDQLDRLLQGDGFPGDSADLSRRAHRVRAHALESLGRLEEAVVELEQLVAQAEAAGDATELVRLSIDLARCYQESGDVSHSLDISRSALARIEALGLNGSDVHAELASTVVGTYFIRGDLTHAAALVRKALADVGARGSAKARAATFWNASVVAQATGRISDALVLAEKALALYAEGDDERALARLRVAYGWLMLRATPAQPKAARDLLLAAHASLEEVGSAVDLAYCETELGRVWLLLGRPKSALSYADQAAERLGEAPRLETAYVALVRGAALLALDRRDEAVANYRSAARLLSSLELSRLAAGAWRELADAFANLALFQDAGLAYQQALTEAGVPAAPDMLPDQLDPATDSAGAPRTARRTR
ncbi:MAG: helix-turn-helix domain-containing protein [Mycobacteriales bacterium]